MGDKVLSKNERVDPPVGWKWEDDWTIDTNRAVDEEGERSARQSLFSMSFFLVRMFEGFEYCVNQSLGGWCPVEKIFHLNRRRRWYRTRILQEEHTSEERKVCSSLADSID